MLPSPRPADLTRPADPLAHLTLPQLDAAIDDTIDVVFTVLKFIRPERDPNATPTPFRPRGWRDTWATVVASLERHELPPPWALAKVASWTLCELQWHAKWHHHLTTEETRVQIAAFRLYDAATRTLEITGD